MRLRLSRSAILAIIALVVGASFGGVAVLEASRSGPPPPYCTQLVGVTGSAGFTVTYWPDTQPGVQRNVACLTFADVSAVSLRWQSSGAVPVALQVTWGPYLSAPGNASCPSQLIVGIFSGWGSNGSTSFNATTPGLSNPCDVYHILAADSNASQVLTVTNSVSLLLSWSPGQPPPY